VRALTKTRISVNIIPHTAHHTTWRIEPGRQLNVEGLLARYINGMMPLTQ
jgi:riboflavin synthase alpha subunit